jgi:hypothetical protein
VATAGCNGEDHIIDVDNPPHLVQGVYSVTGDDQVTIYWMNNQESDIDRYKVYRNSAPTGTFTLIGSSVSSPFVDTQVTNGTTYYYAVAAVDHQRQESDELSYEHLRHAPPEGFGVTLTDAAVTPATAGWDFSAQVRLPSTDVLADVYFNASSGSLIHAVNGVKIQDAGYVALIDVDFGPPADQGWSADGIVEAIPGHSYIVLTPESHYAKFEVHRSAPAAS